MLRLCFCSDLLVCIAAISITSLMHLIGARARTHTHPHTERERERERERKKERERERHTHTIHTLEWHSQSPFSLVERRKLLSVAITCVSHVFARQATRVLHLCARE